MDYYVFGQRSQLFASYLSNCKHRVRVRFIMLVIFLKFC